MKIGIITHFYNSINYGGVLQAYALCRYLNGQGHDAKQISYISKVNKLSKRSWNVKSIWQAVNRHINKKSRLRDANVKQRMGELFSPFREQIPHTNEVYTRESIANVVNNFDIFITGSDQVWNPDWFDPVYMLNFVTRSNSKVSYAASMGVSELTQHQQDIYKSLLSDFAKISVREKECAEVLSNVIEQKIDVCVDPTLLLSKDEWDDIAEENKIGEKYLFLYMLGDDFKTKKLAEEFAKKKGLLLVTIPDAIGRYRSTDRKINAKLILDSSPNTFVSLIKFAEYVFTDSFHACVFSTIYNKEFFVFNRYATQVTNSRIYTLTRMFQCQSHFCSTKETQSLKYLMGCSPIDYHGQKLLFKTVKQDSESFLKNIL